MGTKKALIVGINYTGSGNDLKGCINDANNMDVFLSSEGFQTELLLETEASTSNIKAALNRLVLGAEVGDTLVFHFSGHGSQLPSKVEADGFEEIICPIDLNWTTRVITDKDLKKIFDTVPNGANVTLILDCCHSGSALNQDETLFDAPVQSSTKDIKHNSRFLAPPSKIIRKLENRELVNWNTERDVNKSALLIAGCHSSQTSADAFIDGSFQGAATAAILKSIKKKPQISYKNLVEEMTLYMEVNGYTQRPQLDGSKNLYNELFVKPFGAADTLGTNIAPAELPKKSKRLIAVAIGIAVLIVLALI